MSFVHKMEYGNRPAFRAKLLYSALVLLIFFAPASGVSAAAGQNPGQAEADDTTPARPDTITVEKIDELRKQVESARDVEAEIKAKILETLQQSVDELKRATELETSTRDAETRVKNATNRQENREETLASPNEPQYEDLPADPDLSDLQAAVARRQPARQEAKAQLSQREAEPAVRSERRKQLTERLAKHTDRRADLETQLRAAAPADEPPLMTAARRALLNAKLLAIDREAPAYQQELALLDTEKALGLSALRVQVQKRDVSRFEQEIAELNRRIEERRQKEAKSQAEQLREFASTIQDNTLRQRAEKIAGLAADNEKLTGEIKSATKELETATKELDELVALFARMRSKEGEFGLTEAIGLGLRRQLRNLPVVNDIHRRSRQRRDAMREIQFKQLGYEDESIVADQEISRLELLSSPTPTQDLELKIEKERKSILGSLDKNYNDQFNKISSIDARQQQILETTKAVRTYINERVLWIRSNGVFLLPEVRNALLTFAGLVYPQQWAGVADALNADAKQHSLMYAMAVLAIILLLVVQRRCRRDIRRIGQRAVKPTFFDFTPTLRVAVLTTILALGWPVLLGFVGLRLSSPAVGSEFSVAVGHGLTAVAILFLLLNMVRQSCRPFGLGSAHFNWPNDATEMLRRRVFWLMIIILPLAFVVATLHPYETQQGRDALERAAFIGGLLTLAWFLYCVLHPKQGVFPNYLARQQTGWAHRMRLFWFPLAYGVPVVLAVMAFVGYFFTAEELTWRLTVTICVLASLLYLREFLVRWFVVNNRRIRIEHARERRAALMEQQAADAETDPNAELVRAAVAPTVGEEESDLQIVGEQTNRLINTGLVLTGLVISWALWIDVLPALRILDNYELWTTTAQATVESIDADGIATVRSEQRVVSITVASILLAILLGSVTITAARNVPGLLEIALLQRLPLEPASRYAIRTVTRYVISAVGIIFTFSAIGIGWAKVQWLLAALTVGLGFGLQEIFANFVSGLIILFERPVRIGDVVTIDNVSGTISRIQIRATTITDWDRKDYIVPNKEFVTGRILNWTLLDRTNRIVILVGVAYGTDTTLARALLLKVARDHEKILEEPAAVATLDGFGDSTLNLVLRCYLPSLDGRLATMSDLHEMIDCEFKQAGIEIAFPQQDLHIRSMPDHVEQLEPYPDNGGGSLS